MIAAFSTSAEMLIAARALLGLAGATVAPSTLSLIHHMFQDPRQRTTAIGVWITSYSVGGAIGPLLGGLLIEFFWWGSVFLLAVPVMVLLLIAGPRLLPEYRDPAAGRLDLLSAGLSGVAVLSVIYGLKEVAQGGIVPSAVLGVAFGLVVGAAFVVRQRRLTDPLLDLRLFRAPTFSAALATNTLSLFATFGIFVFSAQYLQLVAGLSPLEAGVWSLPSSVAFIAGSTVTPMIVRRARPASVIAVGLGIASLGFAALTQVGTDSLGLIVTAIFVLSLGLAPVFTLTTDLIVGAAPPERAGAASALSETGSEFGGALGIAVLGSIGTAVYRGRMEDAVPAGVPPASAAAARDTLGGAVAAADTLPEPLAVALLDASRDAFVQAMQLTAALGIVLTAATALMVAIVLRRARTGGAAHGSGETPEPIVEIGGEQPVELAQAA